MIKNLHLKFKDLLFPKENNLINKHYNLAAVVNDRVINYFT